MAHFYISKYKNGLLLLPQQEALSNYYHIYNVIVSVLRETDLYNSFDVDIRSSSVYCGSQSHRLISKSDVLNVINHLTITTMINWPNEFELQLNALRNNGVNLIRYYNKNTTPETREVYRNFYNCYSNIFAFRYNELQQTVPSKARLLTDLEWLQILHKLMDFKGYTSLCLNLSTANNGASRIMFKCCLRRAVEGIFYRLQTGISFSKIPANISQKWEITQFIKSTSKDQIDAILEYMTTFFHEDSRKNMYYSCLLVDPTDITKGLTDIAWLKLRKYVPFGPFRGNHLKSNRPRKIANELLKRLSLRPDIFSKRFTYDSEIAYWKNNKTHQSKVSF